MHFLVATIASSISLSLGLIVVIFCNKYPGKLIILPVDQGFEHGPDRSFSMNPDSYDPHYHINLAVEAGLSAFAAPLGMIEAGALTFKDKIPFILKCNSSNSFTNIMNENSVITLQAPLQYCML